MALAVGSSLARRGAPGSFGGAEPLATLFAVIAERLGPGPARALLDGARREAESWRSRTGLYGAARAGALYRGTK